MSAPGHSGDPITVEQFDALPEDNSHRYEIEDGLLLVMNRPSGPHLLATQRLTGLLNDQLPEDWEAVQEFEGEFSGVSPRRIPDVVVLPADKTDAGRFHAEDARLAIEVVSPGESWARDYGTKAAEYAANGIPYYWVVDVLSEDGPGVTVHALDHRTGRYSLLGRFTGTYETTEPFELTIDLDTLTGPRRKRQMP
ncbi:Uma2 family endonuclease [Solihabitans fulvus]|uniref:Uma2 family endonuclease n=1 Tax=Solihabitans fulvus TaxID=1892852 RepID=UPI0016620548|nr:Uma2 family endonuclease [Solihabitans fulvus]